MWRKGDPIIQTPKTLREVNQNLRTNNHTYPQYEHRAPQFDNRRPQFDNRQPQDRYDRGASEVQTDREFYPPDERAGFNYGNSLVKMVLSIMGGESEREEQFLRGMNKAIYRELKERDNRFNRAGA